jgi:hypothetical protein
MKLNYKEQVLTLRHKDKPIIVETPAGLIVLNRDADDGRKIRLQLPPGTRAFIGKEKLFADSSYLAEENGKIIPKHGLLAPIYEDNGDGEPEFVGFGKPDVLTINEVNDGTC